MTRSHFHQPPHSGETQNIAQGYGICRGILFHDRWRVFPQQAPAGLWSTPSDLARLILAIQAAQSGAATGPMTPAIAREFVRPQFDGWMGMGVFLDGQGEGRGFWHAGETWGYFARFGAGVSNGKGWIIMCNAQNDCFQPILQAIARESHVAE
jgi:hypothetical protein